MFDEIIENEKQEIIDQVCEVIKFKSVSNETNNEEIPFGEECKKVLDYVLDLGKSFGFRTKNIDGYCGYIEFGEGEEVVGIIGHLDVVPADEKDGWTQSPFEPQIRDNKIFGRGSIDDKGPVMASLYAMKAVKESGVKLNKRIRLILGLNEEKDWKCINHYKESGEEIPKVGFSPDADFPTIYAEKGILSLRIFAPCCVKNAEILEIDCQNNALNVVPKYCSITLKLNENINFENTDKIKVEKISENTVKITATGVSAHAAHPDLGENAITNLFQYLMQNTECALLQKFSELGIFDITSPKFLANEKIEDESGILTSNIGFANYENGEIEIGINLRVPVNTSLDEIQEKYEKIENCRVKTTLKHEPLYIEKDSKLVKTLTEIFNQKTGLNLEPIAIGGGTFARAFPNCVAFGANMPGQKDMCHQVDEFIDIDTLILSSKIYAQAIYELGK